VEAYWQGLIQGRSGAGPITKFDAANFKTQFACEVRDFDPLHVLAKAEIRKYDLFTQYALVATDEAIRRAQIDFEPLNKDRIGVIWASGDGGVATFEEQLSEYKSGDGRPRFNPFFIPKRIINMAAGLISIKYGLRGVNYATVSACSASNTAIIDAFNYIRWNKADVMITGGSEASITESSIGGFNASRAMSTKNDDFATASRPFDAARDGFVLGEGAGAVILESLEHALARNAPILAEIVGGGLAADAYHMTGTHPEGDGACLGMTLALEEAGIAPEQVDYINAHATSTPTGDTSEWIAMTRLFGNSSGTSVSATKSMTGHLLGAAGAIEAIACIQAVRENIIPPTINTETLDPELDDRLELVIGKAESKTVDYALSNTFGFGGHIACSIFKKFQD
jgi:3-oxoacyl-[acyl-carrier-protein] synthase II